MGAEKLIAKKILGKAGKTGVSKYLNPNTAIAGLSFAWGAHDRYKNDGDSFGTAVLKEIPSTLAYAAAPGMMMAIDAARLAPSLISAYTRADAMLESKYNAFRKPGTHFTYQDTQQAQTMRQAAVQAIQGSKLNARNALGGEASLMHKGYGERMGI